MAATIPEDESGRLDALVETGILGSEPEPEFDALAWMAAHACDTPAGLVSLVDADRTYYKARVGVDLAGGAREGSLCAAAVAASGLLVVEDTLADDRFRTGPDATGPLGVRFYAGAPILLRGRYPVGTVCVIDRVARTLDEERRTFLDLLARQAAALLDARVLRADLERKSDLLRAVVEESIDPVYVKDLEGRYIYANPALERLVGRSASELLGRRVDLVFDEVSAREMEEHDRRVLASGQMVTIEQTVGTGPRARVFVTRKGVFRDAAGRAAGLVGISHDVTARKRLEEKLAWDACHDPLTALLNRAAFLDRLGRMLQRSGYQSTPAALLYVDLDGFKEVNDRFGHPTGDAVLSQVARRLEECVRPGDVVGRLGGDEFGVALGDAEDPGMPTAVADRICEALSFPTPTDGGDVQVSASVGVAIGIGGDPLDLVRRADVALYRAKAAGKGRSQVFV